jgi:hypothetical protein
VGGSHHAGIRAGSGTALARRGGSHPRLRWLVAACASAPPLLDSPPSATVAPIKYCIPSPFGEKSPDCYQKIFPFELSENAARVFFFYFCGDTSQAHPSHRSTPVLPWTIQATGSPRAPLDSSKPPVHPGAPLDYSSHRFTPMLPWTHPSHRSIPVLPWTIQATGPP